MRHLIIVTTMLVLFSLPDSASAQQEVILDNVTNSISEFQLIGGKTHVFSFRFRNFPPAACTTYGYNINDGFIFTSPDGATWDHTTGVWTDSFLSNIWFSTSVNSFDNPLPGFVDSGDGISPDYVGAEAILISPSLGMLPGYDDIALQIEIATKLADTNLHICVDMSELGRLSTWEWSSVFGCSVVPDWGGPYCFTIVACCQGSVGNVDFDAAGVVDISDLTVLIDHLFINFPPLACEAEANIDGDPQGIVDITDLTVLIDHLFLNFPQLPSCQ